MASSSSHTYNRRFVHYDGLSEEVDHLAAVGSVGRRETLQEEEAADDGAMGGIEPKRKVEEP